MKICLHTVILNELDEYLKNGEFERCAIEMNFKSAEDMFASIGYGETTLNKVINKLKKPIEEKELTKIDERENLKHKKGSKKDDIIGLEGMLWSLAKCCSPVPGEAIAGVITRSRGVSVHRLDCKSLFNVEPERIMDIRWANSVSSVNYQAHLRVESQDRIGLLKDIISKVSDTDTNISYANSYLKAGKFGIIDIGLELNSIEKLNADIFSFNESKGLTGDDAAKPAKLKDGKIVLDGKQALAYLRGAGDGKAVAANTVLSQLTSTVFDNQRANFEGTYYEAPGRHKEYIFPTPKSEFYITIPIKQ